MYLAICKLMMQSNGSEQQGEAQQDQQVKALEARTMLFVSCKVFHSFLMIILGDTPFMRTEELLQSSKGLANAQLAKKLLPFAHFLMMTFWLIRLVLLILSLRWKKTTRAFFYVEILVEFTQSLLPTDVGSSSFYLHARIQASWVDFTFTYFSWWPSMSCQLLVLASFHFTRTAFYDESALNMSLHFILSALFSTIILANMHTLVTKIDSLYFTPTDLSKNTGIANSVLDHL